MKNEQKQKAKENKKSAEVKDMGVVSTAVMMRCIYAYLQTNQTHQLCADFKSYQSL